MRLQKRLLVVYTVTAALFAGGLAIPQNVSAQTKVSQVYVTCYGYQNNMRGPSKYIYTEIVPIKIPEITVSGQFRDSDQSDKYTQALNDDFKKYMDSKEMFGDHYCLVSDTVAYAEFWKKYHLKNSEDIATIVSDWLPKLAGVAAVSAPKQTPATPRAKYGIIVRDPDAPVVVKPAPKAPPAKKPVVKPAPVKPKRKPCPKRSNGGCARPA